MPSLGKIVSFLLTERVLSVKWVLKIGFVIRALSRVQSRCSEEAK